MWRDRTSTSPTALLALVLGVSVAARVAVAWLLGNEIAPLPGIVDQVSYHTLAERLAGGHGFTFAVGWWPATAAGAPTAHWSFLYVSWLAAVYSVVGAQPIVPRLLQAVLVGLLQPWLTWRIASRLFGARAGLSAAAIAAVYGYFVYYAGALMTESFYAVALLWTIDAALGIGLAERRGEPWAWRRWARLGSALSAAVLLRQVALLFAPVLLAWLAWRLAAVGRHPQGARSLARAFAGRVAVVAAILAVCIAPWSLRNLRVFDTFVPLNTNAGFVVFWANHPVHGSRFMPILPGDGAAYGALIPADLAGLDEASLDAALLRRGLQFIADDPVRYLQLCGGRLVEYLKFWPSRDSGTLSNVVRVASFGACLPLFIWGLIVALGAPRDRVDSGDARRAGAWLLGSVVVVSSAVHVATWALIRYRLPMDALLVPFAGCALATAYERLAAHRRTGSIRPA